MEKIKYFLLFLIISLITFGKSIDSIKDITFEVEEKLYMNNDTKKSEYVIKYIKPDFIRKEVLKPELNKGEIYIYSEGKKIVYLPLFDQISEESIVDGEDSTLESLNYIMKEKELKDGEMTLTNGITLKLEKLKKVSGYTLPESLTIYDGKIKVASLKIKNYRIDSNLNREELALHD